MNNKLSDEFINWKTSVLKQISKSTVHSDKARLYNIDKNLKHYESVSTKLLNSTSNLDLAKAGFLHGLDHTKIVDSLKFEGDLDFIINLLNDRERLATLLGNEESVSNMLTTSVLPSITKGESILLFLIERLDHIDTESKLSDWTIKFHQIPLELPESLDNKSHYETRDTDPTAVILATDSIYSKTAEYFGLWMERNIFKNISFFNNNPQRFADLVRFILDKIVSSKKHYMIIRILKEKSILNDVIEINWRWRHLAGIEKRIGNSRLTIENVFRYAGYINIICPDDESCYRNLYRLHNSFEYNANELCDYICNPVLNYYKALRTELIIKNIDTQEINTISVRLIPSVSQSSIKNIFSANSLIKINRHLQKETNSLLKVYTPHGKVLELPNGSTVLNFAYKIKNGFVAHINEVFVNKIKVGILYELKPHDVVNLIISNNFVPLPMDLLEKMKHLQDSRKQYTEEERRFIDIYLRYKREYRIIQRDKGRTWIRKKLFQKGLEIPDNIIFDYLVGEVFKEVTGKDFWSNELKDQKVSDSVLQQLGIWDSILKEEETFGTLKITMEVANEFFEKLVHKILKTRNEFENNIFTHRTSIPGIEKMQICSECSPNIRERLVGIKENGILKLHKSGAACCRGEGYSISFENRTPLLQYFTIISYNRIGISKDILEVFKRFNIDVLEYYGRRIQINKGIHRVTIDYMDGNLTEVVKKELKDNDSILNVFTKDDNIRTQYEHLLPPPRFAEIINEKQSSPYISGPAIRNYLYFYGREFELSELRKAYNNIITNPSQIIFVNGTLRIGKSSLVQIFLNEVNEQNVGKVFTCYYECAPSISWDFFVKELKEKILESLKPFEIEARELKRYIKKNNLIKPEDIFDLINYVQDELQCQIIIVIDEIINLFNSCEKTNKHPYLINFLWTLLSREHRLLILVGPSAGVDFLKTESQHLFQRATEIKLSELKYDNTCELIEAKKIAPNFNIYTSPGLVKTIYSLTLGHPYYVSLLGNSMFKSSELTSDESFYYNNEVLEKAVDDFVKTSIHISDKVSFDKGGLSAKILNFISSRSKIEFQYDWINENYIIRKIKNSFENITTAEVKNKLKFLEKIGTLDSNFSTNKKLWKIRYPLIGEYLKKKSQNERELPE